LSRAWKDKDFGKIRRIYQRSSINQLLFACGIFVLIWINFTDGVNTFHMQSNYLQAQNVFLFLGLIRVIDMGTGLNSQIIGTSAFWRFEFITGIIILAISLPLNYILAKRMGVVGPAIATLLAAGIYNTIRYFFLLRKFNMQPFNIRTLFTIGLAILGYYFTHLLFSEMTGIPAMILRTAVFLLIYTGGAFLLRLSPDILPIWNTLKKKIPIPYLRSRK
jgi:hypothetical protein